MRQAMKILTVSLLLPLCRGVFTGSPAAAQVPAQVSAQMPTAPAMGAATTTGGSLLQQPPRPASVTFADGKLSIEAMNSSLRAILDDLERRTGTRVEGLSKDERIFGVYGPGDPQEVLAALLDDSGYNVLISGQRADGAPRAITLSTRTTSAAVAGGTKTQASDEEDDGEETPAFMQPAPVIPPQPASAAPAGNGQQQVKTPQQMLEELQRLRLGANTPAAQASPQP